jgi:hypothetical protein
MQKSTMLKSVPPILSCDDALPNVRRINANGSRGSGVFYSLAVDDDSRLLSSVFLGFLSLRSKKVNDELV